MVGQSGDDEDDDLGYVKRSESKGGKISRCLKKYSFITIIASNR